MKLTAEQEAIIHSSGDIKINAVAGSGKTTTIIQYAMAKPSAAKILYLAFNKSVKLEAAKKFAGKGLKNVKVETAHSLAYKHIVFKHQYKVKNAGYKTTEIQQLLHLEATGEKHAEYIVANHINKFITYFCNSSAKKIQDLNYLEVVSDSKARTFVKTFYPYIEKQTRLLLQKMDTGEIEITHDFYLKKFQLAAPQLGFDYILFDEGQDASPAILDIFLNQKATKVIIGDTHQQIYGWRYAVNSLEKVNFKAHELSASFRFGQDIANLAMKILHWKDHLGTAVNSTISGKGTSKEHKSIAVIGRTNLGLLLKAIEYVKEKKQLKHLYFEGNFNSYTYADDGASLYDVLSLHNANHFMIKDALIKSMSNLDDLEDYIKKTEDVQLGMMVEIVKQYGNEIPEIIKNIKAKQVSDEERHKAEFIFSTVHRAKGMEYDAVHLVKDFITEDKVIKYQKDDKKDAAGITRLNEEINLLYVAITRTKKSLYIPEELMPAEFPASPNIHVEVAKPAEEINPSKFSGIKNYRNNAVSFDDSFKAEEKNYTTERNRAVTKNAAKPWTTELDEELTIMYCNRTDVYQMAAHFQRTTGAIQSRIKKLELAEIYG